MGIPSELLTVRDPGLGLVEQSDNAVFLFGCSSLGNNNEVKAISSPKAAVDSFGQGPMVEDLAYILSVAGGPVYACKLQGTVAGVATAVTKTPFSTSTGTITVAGAPYDRYVVYIEVTLTGALGVGKFRYSLDYNKAKTFSEELTIPSGGTYAIPNTNMTLTFVPGGGPIIFERYDYHTFTAAAPHYSTTEMAAGFVAMSTFLSVTPGIDAKIVVFSGRNATGSAAATLFGALSVQLAAQTTTYKYMRAIIDAGSGDTKTNVKTAFAAVADARICAVYGDADIISGKPFAGFGGPLRCAYSALAGRAARSLISTDLARFSSGPLSGVLGISHDEFITEEMDAAKISTLRTWPAVPGYFVTNARLKSAAGSDYVYWQHGRIMDIACSTTAAAQLQFISMGVLVKADGSIDDSEAERLEALVEDPLNNALLAPKNVEGTAGHCSAVGYSIDRTNNILTSFTLQSTVAVRPFGYIKNITTELGFAANVGGVTDGV